MNTITEMTILSGGANKYKIREHYYLINTILAMSRAKVVDNYWVIEGVNATIQDDGLIVFSINSDTLRIPVDRKDGDFIVTYITSCNFNPFADNIKGDCKVTFDTMHKQRHTVEVPARDVQAICSLKDKLTYPIFGDKLLNAYGTYVHKIPIEVYND